MKQTGIYKITNPNGRVYIGQSVDIKRRFKTYLNNVPNVKTSIKLYRSLIKYGSENHKFEILELCDINELNNRERYYQELYEATSSLNLNCILTECDGKKRVVRPMTEKQKKQISLVHKGKKYSEETKNKIKLARAKQIITAEHKQKISDNSGSARLVLNLQNGIFYNSAKEASNAHNMKANELVCRLIGRIKNNSNLKYV
jgi:group I intron endonuclease